MNLTIHSSFLPLADPEASLAFYRDVLGFEVRLDVGQGAMRWLTIGPAGQGDTNIVLYPPQANPGITDAEKDVIADMMAKGTFASLLLATPDVDAAFAEIERHDVEIVQEPTDQPYGVRDCALRDPAGNLIRLQQRP
ncbi:VOC family protein [Demequina litorisediminis]|uniref:Glyoxalase n=2 Tax=Demequina TaxID=577469 RepID=A0ABQ6IJP8_9MICO|nr:VOC family protein [Demequina litorisediminis]GMA37626.1 glyoxalase [Demequina litorisediminis]